MIRKIYRGLERCLWFLIALFMVIFPRQSVAQFQPPGRIEITSTPNPVGSGARALGMGGAFIAVADDATAASWNPGGLVQLEKPEISAVSEAVRRVENNTFSEYPEASRKQSDHGVGLNFLSAVYPFTGCNHNMVVSLNYQHLYDFSRKWNLVLAGDQVRQTWKYEADGGLYAWGMAYAVQIIPQLSFGFTLNIWQDGIYPNGWEAVGEGVAQLKSSLFQQEFRFKEYQRDRYSFSGFNSNVGLLWNVTDQLTFGAVFKTPFTANLEHELTLLSVQTQPRPQNTQPLQESQTTEEELAMPMSYGIGLAYRFSDRFTVSADVTRTEWEDFVLTDATGRKISPITKDLASTADVSPTTQVHVGAEYLFIKPQYTIPVRAGFFYDPAPAPHSPDNYFGFSLGTGVGIGRFIFDVAYVYRVGIDVGKSTVPDLNLSQNVKEHSLFTSLIIHF